MDSMQVKPNNRLRMALGFRVFEICRLDRRLLAKVHLINREIKCVLGGRHNDKTTGGSQRLHLIKVAQTECCAEALVTCL